MERSLRPESLVRKMSNSAVIKLRDLDGMTIPNEIVDATFRETGVTPMDSKVHKYTKDLWTGEDSDRASTDSRG